MLRLFDRYAGLIFFVLLTAVMVPFRYAVAPFIVEHWGLAGTLGGLAALFALAYCLDR